MRAMVLRTPAPIAASPLEAAELPLPEPGPGEIRVRVLTCGICHTDLHTVEGELRAPRLPLVPGHQVVGLVDRLGAGVTHPRPGERVGLPWLHATCGSCRPCRTGAENLCREASFTGLHHDGGYAEFAIARASFAEPIPPGLGDDAQVAPLLCAGIIGYRALRLCGLRPGERLGLYGFGASAHLCLQVARHFGCRVLVFSRSAAHLTLARELGAIWTGQPDERPPEELDRAINFTPAGALIPPALESLRRGGTLALAGITLDRIPELDYHRHLYFERSIISVANATRRDATELLQLAAEIPLRADVHEFPLAEANHALRLLQESRLPAGAGVLRLAERPGAPGG